MNEDRRRYPRNASFHRLVVVYRGEEIKATTTNLSVTGAFLATRRPLPLGAKVTVHFLQADPRSPKVPLEAEVVREESSGAGGQPGFGVRWLTAESHVGAVALVGFLIKVLRVPGLRAEAMGSGAHVVFAFPAHGQAVDTSASAATKAAQASPSVASGSRRPSSQALSPGDDRPTQRRPSGVSPAAGQVAPRPRAPRAPAWESGLSAGVGSALSAKSSSSSIAGDQEVDLGALSDDTPVTDTPVIDAPVTDAMVGVPATAAHAGSSTVAGRDPVDEVEINANVLDQSGIFEGKARDSSLLIAPFSSRRRDPGQAEASWPDYPKTDIDATSVRRQGGMVSSEDVLAGVRKPTNRASGAAPGRPSVSPGTADPRAGYQLGRKPTPAQSTGRSTTRDSGRLVGPSATEADGVAPFGLARSRSGAARPGDARRADGRRVDGRPVGRPNKPGEAPHSDIFTGHAPRSSVRQMVKLDVPVTYEYDNRFVPARLVSAEARALLLQTRDVTPGSDEEIVVNIPIDVEGVFRTVYVRGRLLRAAEEANGVSRFLLHVDKLNEGKHAGAFEQLLGSGTP